MNFTALLDFLRRELAPTPGRGRATLRLTLACLVATLPILDHQIPFGYMAMAMLFMIAHEDTAATIMGSILLSTAFTIGVIAAFLVFAIALDVPWLRLCFLITSLFGCFFLERALRIGALGMVSGLLASLIITFPDTMPPSPEALSEAALWLWWSGILGLAVNAVVYFLLAPQGDPLTLLRRELDSRLLAVEQSLRRLAAHAAEPPAASLNALAIAGMSRPLSLLKSASIFQPWARARRDQLAAIITLTDRLVTAAVSLEALAPLAAEAPRPARLLAVADGCERTRLAFKELRLPAPGKWAALAGGETSGRLSPLADMERTLDQIALAVPASVDHPSESAPGGAEKPGLFVADAFTNPEYVHFAIKGTLAALFCYLCYIGFDYPGISTSMITCIMVSLTTAGASTQKGILRFGGVVVGGLISMVVLVYVLPHVDTIGGFLLVFGACIAAAAWVYFGSPRISYAGFQLMLVLCMALVHSGPSVNLTVIRDRIIGIFFGLSVLALVEHALWPVRATEALRLRVAELLHLLAELARTGVNSETQTASSKDAGWWRQRVSLKVQEIQRLIESSKFEPGDVNLHEIQQRTGDAQMIFILLLALARQGRDVTEPHGVRTAVVELDSAIATALEAVETRAADGSAPAVLELEETLQAFEHAMTGTEAFEKEGTAHLAGRLALYRTLVATIKRLVTGGHTHQPGDG